MGKVRMAEFVSYKDHFLIAAPNMKDPTFAGTVFFVHAVLFTSLPYLFDKMFTNANYADKEKKGWNTQWKR